MMQTLVLLNFESGNVHFLPIEENDDIESEAFNNRFHDLGIRLSNCEWMVCQGNDFMRGGWAP